jgi:hypothetical protein
MKTEIIAEKIMLESKLFAATNSSQKGLLDKLEKTKNSIDIRKDISKEEDLC